MATKTAPPIVLAIVALMSWSGGAQAQETSDLPLFELGFGLAARSTPDYPAADSRSNRLAIFPHIIYRGRFFEVGEEETFRFVPFRTNRIELAVSIDGAASVERRSDPIRGEVPDLDALAEFGPEIIWRAAEVAPVIGDRTRARMEIALQTRGVFAVGDDVSYEGFLVRPVLRFRQNGAIKPGSRVEATIGPVFATSGVHEYFYDVDAGGGAPGYQSDAGYLGTELTASVRYPVSRRARVFGGFGVAYLGGAANRDSPLYETDVNATAFLGLTFSIYQSKARGVRDR